MVIEAHIAVGPVMCSLQGEGLGVVAVIEDVGRYLHVGSTVGAARRVHLHIEAGNDLPQISEGSERLAVFDNGFELLRDGGALVLSGRDVHARLDIAGQHGTITILNRTVASAQHWVRCAVVLESLSILLRGQGLFAVHAAALSRGGEGLLVVAAADNGKSTLALRLVQQGWDYLSDDTALLEAAPHAVQMHALRSHFSLDPDAETLFPGIAQGREASLLKEEKWALNVEALYPKRRVEVSTPRVLVFPRIADAEESRVEPVSDVEALGQLLRQSSLVRVPIDHSEEHLATLGRLIGQTRAYRLHAGRDLLKDPTRADALMRTLFSHTFSAA